MPHSFTLFTGQWADLPLEEVARLASSWGYDGLELACWGDGKSTRLNSSHSSPSRMPSSA